jgi:purine-binding chemotaxis protein CheW
VPEPIQLIVFALGERSYALRTSVVEMAVRMVEITPLPKAPEIVLGVIDFHGVITPVLNMRRRFRLPEREPRLDDQLIIARSAGRLVALVADRVSDVVALPEEAMVAPESILPALEYVAGVAKLEDGMIFIHDLDAFLSLEEEQALAAAIEGNIKPEQSK